MAATLSPGMGLPPSCGQAGTREPSIQVPQAGKQAPRYISPVSSNSKESACDVGNPASVPGWERSPGEENGNPRQYPCLENPMDRGAWWASVHGVTQSQTRPSDEHFQFHETSAVPHPAASLSQHLLRNSVMTLKRFTWREHHQSLHTCAHDGRQPPGGSAVRMSLSKVPEFLQFNHTHSPVRVDATFPMSSVE